MLNYRIGDFILHLAGFGGRRKEEVANKTLNWLAGRANRTLILPEDRSSSGRAFGRRFSGMVFSNDIQMEQARGIYLKRQR